MLSHSLYNDKPAAPPKELTGVELERKRETEYLGTLNYA
jgi:hypothetical protein